MKRGGRLNWAHGSRVLTPILGLLLNTTCSRPFSVLFLASLRIVFACWMCSELSNESHWVTEQIKYTALSLRPVEDLVFQSFRLVGPSLAL